MYDFAREALPNLDQLRDRLKKMSDEQLISFGKAARYMCSPKANMGKPPLEAFIMQLREAREEWQRRHSKPWSNTP